MIALVRGARSAEDASPKLGPTRLASLCLFLSLPITVVVMIFVVAIGEGSAALDFGQFHYAAEAVLRGDDPYAAMAGPPTPWGSPYPYPPLPALAVIPLSLLPLEVARAVVMGLLVLVALAIPYVLGVRDWRCFGVALLWPPVISAIQTGNLSLPLALAAAVAWRWRDETARVSVVAGVGLAAKFFLWPLCVWLAATWRLVAAATTVVLAASLTLLSWLVIGFSGLVDYPALMRRLYASVGGDAYTLYNLGLDLGLSSELARGLWLAVGCALVACVVVFGGRGEDRMAFAFALAASLALAPIVWLHYLALLLVVVSLAQARLGAVWFAPLLLILVPGGGHPTPLERAWVLAVVALTFAMALRRLRSAVPSRHLAAVPA